MHSSTFEYLKPTEDQMAKMMALRAAANLYASVLEEYLPDGPDRTYAMRKFREVAMWANIAVTRQTNGEPRPMVADYPADHPAPGDLGSVPL